MNIGNKIIEHCHKEGVKFTFDEDCVVFVKGEQCKRPAEWEYEAKIKGEKKPQWINLCRVHIKLFDKEKKP